MFYLSFEDENGRPASTEEVAEFERSRRDPSRFMITCGPCRWKVHTDLFKGKIYDGPLDKVYEYKIEGNDQQAEKEIGRQDEDALMFARLLQLFYYGTYSHSAYEPITVTGNLTHPGHEGLSPAMIVHNALDPGYNRPKYAAMTAKDDTTLENFGHEIDLNLLTMAERYKVPGLKQHALKKYSTFPSRNHREFYHSVIEMWPTFPFETDTYHEFLYDREILCAVAPHIAKF